MHAAETREQCTMGTQKIVRDLGLAGFVLNHSKSNLKPQQVSPWLGFQLDLNKGMFYVPEEKLSKLISSIKVILIASYIANRVCVRKLASFVGQIISMGLAIGPVSRLGTRALYLVLNSRRYWSDVLPLSCASRDELLFWKSSLTSFNGQSIWFSPGATRLVFFDASSTGYGGCCAVEIGNDIAHGQWSKYEASLSSTWRELVAMVLSAIVIKLAGHRVKWFTDNQNVVRIVEAGSKRKHLQSIAISILNFDLCFKYGICLDMEWIPRIYTQRQSWLHKPYPGFWRLESQPSVIC